MSKVPLGVEFGTKGLGPGLDNKGILLCTLTTFITSSNITLGLASSSILRNRGQRDNDGEKEDKMETRHGHQIREDWGPDCEAFLEMHFLAFVTS